MMSYTLKILLELECQLVEQDAYLRSAVRYGGRIFKGDQGEPHILVAKRHLPFSHLVKVNQDKDFGFVNHKGHYLNRQQAGEYAQANNLIDPKLSGDVTQYDPYQGAISDFLPYRKFSTRKLAA
jgi:hypothetical protein